MYRNGDFVDLCRGPHVPYSTMIQAFNSTRTSATNWLGKVSGGGGREWESGEWGCGGGVFAVLPTVMGRHDTMGAEGEC